jgi:pyruvate/2-oxoacid:ferredoxin oxidoreductase beta subunit
MKFIQSENSKIANCMQQYPLSNTPQAVCIQHTHSSPGLFQIRPWANVFNGLHHGRSLPVATGAKLANPKLTVIVESGDGCNYGEGDNHFLAAIRRNINVTLLVHNNQVYGLTKGQASPTTAEGKRLRLSMASQEGNAVRPCLKEAGVQSYELNLPRT